MTELPSLTKLIGIALVVLAMTGPLSYCVIRQSENETVITKACMDRGGTWSNSWGGYCVMAPGKQ